ncbi:MAG: hypothetical protein AAFU65_09840 [Pseudomonadota bacterium]
MANSTANLISIKRRVQAFVRAQRRNPDRYRVLAEGDSWFTTPVESWNGPTLISSLKRHTEDGRRPFNIVSVANPSTELLSTLHPNNLDLPLATLPDWIKEQSYDLVLLSTGGNDVLGPRMEQMLRDPEADPAVRRCHDTAPDALSRARCILDCDAYNALLDNMIERLVRFRADVLKPCGLNRARIMIHGYDYPIPDGRRIDVLGGLVTVGPWLKPAFEHRNTPAETWNAVLKLLIDEYNARLREAALDQRLFHYVDLRGTLAGADDWADEIHPHKDTGIRKISSVLTAAMRRVRDGRAPSIIGPRHTPGDYRCV